MNIIFVILRFPMSRAKYFKNLSHKTATYDQTIGPFKQFTPSQCGSTCRPQREPRRTKASLTCAMCGCMIPLHMLIDWSRACAFFVCYDKIVRVTATAADTKSARVFVDRNLLGIYNSLAISAEHLHSSPFTYRNICVIYCTLVLWCTNAWIDCK